MKNFFNKLHPPTDFAQLKNPKYDTDQHFECLTLIAPQVTKQQPSV